MRSLQARDQGSGLATISSEGEREHGTLLEVCTSPVAGCWIERATCPAT